MSAGWWEFRAAPVTPSRPLLVGPGALWAFGFTSVAAIGGSLAPVFLRGLPWAAPVGAALACLASFALGAGWSRGDRRGVRRYLGVQTLLLALALGLSQGRAAMAAMPLISQACLVLPPVGVALAVLGWGGLLLGALAPASGATLAQHAVSYVVAGAFTWLFTGVAMRERQARTEVERLAASLAAANARLETLTLERERVRLAHEIHDGLGHALTAARVQLEASRVLFERDPPRAKAGLETASRLIQEGLDDVRQSVQALRERAGAELPLTERLARLCEDGVPTTTLEVDGAPRRLSPAEEHALFRAAQEALTNVRRHASASRASVRLTFRPGEVQLLVDDDGRGLEGAAPGVGLSGVVERAQRHGGRAELTVPPGGGTRLAFHLPTHDDGAPPA